MSSKAHLNLKIEVSPKGRKKSKTLFSLVILKTGFNAGANLGFYGPC